MTVWIIEPHDPLIVRDGKPFTTSAGARSTSLAFPFTSTTTGGVRTQAGLNEQRVFDVAVDIAKLKKFAVRGPLLVQLDDNGAWEVLPPAPLDALLLVPEEGEGKAGRVEMRRLVPIEKGTALCSAFSDSTSQSTDAEKSLALVGLVKPSGRKPAKNVPLYWHWEKFQKWLINPDDECGLITPSEQGHRGPQREQRTHVSIDATRASADDGLLFSTSGLEFTHVEKLVDVKQEIIASPEVQGSLLSRAKRLALAVIVDEQNKFAAKLHDGLVGFGGERRMVSWRKSSTPLSPCPIEVAKQIVKDQACRVILLTPAYFAQGYYPTWLTQEQYGVKPIVEAIAVQRPHVVSGWNLDEKSKGPKPTRRLVPAGTVLFLSLKDASKTDIEKWINNIWMQCVSDDADGKNEEKDQNRLDGFGVAALGTWSGKLAEIDRSNENERTA